MSNPAQYWREIPQRYRYEAEKCKKTGRIFFPPRLVSPGLKNREFEKINLATEGTVATFTVARVGPPNYSDLVPYGVAIVELEDGARITAMLADVDVDEIKIGMKVRIEFRKMYSVGHEGLHCYGYKCVPA